MISQIDPDFSRPSMGLDDSVDVAFSRIEPPEAFAEYIHVKYPDRDLYLVTLLEQFPYLIAMAMQSAFKAEDIIRDAARMASVNARIQMFNAALIHLSDASHYVEGAIELYNPTEAANEYHISPAAGSTLVRCAVNVLMTAAGLDRTSEQREARIEYYNRYESTHFLYSDKDWLDSTSYEGLEAWQAWLHTQFAAILQLKIELEQGVNYEKAQ